MIVRGRLSFAVLLIVVSFFFPVSGTLSAAESPDGGTSSPALAGVTIDQVANLIRVPLIRQYNAYSCGVAALESIFAYYGQDYRGNKLAKALKTTAQNGTDYKNIIKVALANNYSVTQYDPMTLSQLKAFIDARTPVLLAIQAWPTKSVDWAHDWADGHYVVAVGYDSDNFYFMDPATIGNYTYIALDEFINRWHDKDQRGKKLTNFGLVIVGTGTYNPDQIKPLD